MSLALLLLIAQRLPAPVVVLPEEKAKPKATPPPKPKPKPVQRAQQEQEPDPGTETSRQYVGIWSGMRSGNGTIVGKDRRYPYTVSSPISVTISKGGKTGQVRLGDGQLRWPGGGPDGQAVSELTAKPYPSFSLREQSGSLVGTYRTTEGNWVGDRLVRLSVDETGEALRLTIEHTGRNRSSGVSDSSTSSALLRRSGNR